MPTYRPDLERIARYEPGRPLDEVARTHGVDPAETIQLASNESPWGPFPEAVEAMAAAAGRSNRYPDNDAYDLRHELGLRLDVDPGSVWLGGGSSDLLRAIALAVGGPGTAAVYAWPSFVIYRLGAMWALSEGREIPLDDDHRHDLDALATAVDDCTTLVIICNPNNPTGTHLPTEQVRAFVEDIPERVTVVVDEAYNEYVTAADYTSLVPMAAMRPNLVVTRTFSKIYALASLRVGYAVTHPDTVAAMRRAQAPFTVTQVGQAGALASVRHSHRLAARVESNAQGRGLILDYLEDRGIDHADSQANFVWFDSGLDDPGTALISQGVIARTFGGSWVRITVGTDEENRRFLTALGRVL